MHTPGPWFTDGDGREVMGTFEGQHLQLALVGTVSWTDFDKTVRYRHESKANARLMAAAPELLAACAAACQLLFDMADHGTPEELAIARQVDAAIRKATGGEQ